MADSTINKKKAAPSKTISAVDALLEEDGDASSSNAINPLFAKQIEQEKRLKTMQRVSTIKRQDAEDIFAEQVTSTAHKKKNKKLTKQDQKALIVLYISKILDHLKHTRTSLSTGEMEKLITEDSKFEDFPKDLLPNLIEELKKNPKINFDKLARNSEGTFAYETKFKIQNREEMLDLLKSSDHILRGVDAKELADSYAGADKDIAELKREKLVFEIEVDKKVMYLYYSDPTYRVDVDPRLREFFQQTMRATREITTRGMEELEFALTKCGLKPMKQVEFQSDLEAKKRMLKDIEEKAKLKKQRKRKRQVNIQNTHIQNTTE